MTVPSLPADGARDMVAAYREFGEFRDVPGLGDDEVPGFPVDVCPEELPDLAKHHSVLADVLKKDPSLYVLLKDRRTSLGVGLAKCIKTGIDNRGHPMIKTAGVVAGDEECYVIFKDLFQRILEQKHRADFKCAHVSDFTRSRLTRTRADSSGAYVLSSQIRLARSLTGKRFPPAVTKDERREIERIISRALLELEGPLKGDYLPLPSSWSFASKPGGMKKEEEESLRASNLVFDQPDSSATLCSGIGRHWPDARGVFVNSSKTFCAWVNEEEHIRAICSKQGDDVQAAFCEMADALDAICSSLKKNGDCPNGFARSETFGFLTSCLASIGTSMRVSVIVCLPLLAHDHKSLTAWCGERRLAVRSAINEGGVQLPGMFEVSNIDRLGITEIQTVNLVVECVAELVKAEIRVSNGLPGLDSGFSISDAAAAEATMKAVESLRSVESPTPSELEDAISWQVAGQAFGKAFVQAVESEQASVQAIEQEQKSTSASAETEAAVTKIQSIHRGRASRRDVQEHRRRSNSAAVAIQSAHRGRAARAQPKRSMTRRALEDSIPQDDTKEEAKKSARCSQEDPTER
jgi:creatine kinase